MGAGFAIVSSATGTVTSIASGVAATGCATHLCDTSAVDYFGGFMLDRDTFVTSRLGDPWIDYQGNETVRIWFPKEVAGRIPKGLPLGAVGTDATPNGGPSFEGGDSYVSASGQLAYYNFLNTNMQTTPGGVVTGGGFWATNGTCAKYFAYFQVNFVPVDDGGPATEDAAASEASTQAGLDASRGVDGGATSDEASIESSDAAMSATPDR